MAVKITDKDRGYRALAAELSGVATVELGVFGAAAAKRHPDHGAKGSITVGQLAAMHELGLGGQKERSFVRAWMDANAAKMVAEAKTALSYLGRGASKRAILEGLGKHWADGVRSYIYEGRVQPPNAPRTVEWKGHSTPLIGRTETLAKAVGARVTVVGGTVRAAAMKLLRSL